MSQKAVILSSAGFLPAIALLLLSISGCPQMAAPTAAKLPTTDGEQPFGGQLQAVEQGSSTTMILESRPVTLDDLQQLPAIARKLQILTIEQGAFSEVVLKQFVDAEPVLQRLKLGHGLQDADLEQLARIQTLRVLNLPGGQFSDAGLTAVASLPQLELLRFSSPHVTDLGLAAVARSSSLKFLHVIDTPLTDAALESVAHMSQLESFYLDGGHCTEAGLSQLVKQRPDLHFHWNDLHLPSDAAAHPH